MLLKTGENYRTSDGNICGKILKGSLLVYIYPMENGNPCRKLYLCTVKVGEYIPFLHILADNREWSFQFSALEASEIQFLYNQTLLEKARSSFAEQIGVFLFKTDMFQDEIIEKYNMEMVREEAYLYASAKERITSIENCKRLIKENISGDAEKIGHGKITENGKKNLLYQAISYLCKKEKINYLLNKKLEEKYIRQSDFFQIVVALGITARKISLQPGWYKKNIGSFIGIKKEGYPVVLFRKLRGYYAYDPMTGKTSKVDEKYEDTINLSGIVIYPPFEKTAIGLRDLFWFGIRSTSLANWIMVFFLTVVSAWVALLFPISYEYLTNVLLEVADEKIIVEFATLIVICMGGYFCITFVKNLIVYGNLNRIQNIVMPAIYDRLFHLPESIIRKYHAADLGQRAVRVTRIFRDALRNLISAGLGLIYSLIFGICMLCYNFRIGLWLLLCTAVFVAISILLCRKHMKEEKSKQKEEGEMNALMFQYLSGIQKIRTDGMEDRALYESLKKYVKLCDTEKEQSRNETWNIVLTKLYSGIVMFVLFLFYLQQTVELDMGRFVALLTVSELFVQNISATVTSFLQADFLFPTYDRCKPILRNFPEAEENVESIERLDGKVELTNVSFTYAEGEADILKNLTLKVETGDYIGIVGPSGSGKSTLFQILLGFEKPNKGSVFYDNKDLQHLNKSEVRKNIGIVLQDEALFTGSIYENIAVSVEKLTQDEAWKLLDEVSLKEEVEQMPMGLHTLVTESGNTISGGQKQRILLARALAGKPSILFLDEATSALDNDTQTRIMKMLEKKKITRIVIAHRVNTVKNCNKIFVLEKGKIVESGTYDELFSKKGSFYELAKRQLFSF